MFRKAFSFGGLLLLAGALVLVTPGFGQAQHRGGGGFSHGGFNRGFHGGGFNRGFNRRFDFDRRFFDPRFGRFDRDFDGRFFFDPRFDRRFFDPRFGGLNSVPVPVPVSVPIFP
jgi:hypothetical protein